MTIRKFVYIKNGHEHCHIGTIGLFYDDYFTINHHDEVFEIRYCELISMEII